jgi:hypothetical protein
MTGQLGTHSTGAVRNVPSRAVVIGEESNDVLANFDEAYP